MEISKKFEIVVNHHERLLKRHASLTKSIARLTSFGCVNASEYWKDGKYLYYLYPMKNGKRRKVYIGNHPLRIKEAKQKIQNYHKRNDLITNQNNIERDIKLIEHYLYELLRLCSKEDLTAQSVLLDGYKF